MFSINTYNGTGSAYPYAVTFPYLSKDHVEVRVGGVLQTSGYTWTSASTISITAPAGTRNVDIRRNTPASNPEVIFQDGSTLTDSDLNSETLQLLYIAQETADSITDTNDRTIHYPVGEVNTVGTLPLATGRSNMLLGFDSSGNVAVLPITASVGAGDMRTDTFVAGVDFTAGVTTQLTLSRAPGTVANAQIHFDATYQGPEQVTSVVGAVLTFASAIPVGVQKVYVTTGTVLSTQTPPDGSVSASKIIDGSVTDLKVAAGSKLRNRLSNIVDVNDYMVAGHAADYAFAQAIAYLAALGGGEVFVPQGTYSFAAGVDVPGNIKIRGAGFNSCIRATSAITYLFRAVTGDAQQFENLQLDGNSYLAGNGILNYGRAYVKVSRVLVTGCTNGFNHQDTGIIVNGPTIVDLVSLNNTTGIYLQGGAINTQIDRLYHEGGDGVILDKATNHNEGTVIAKPIIKPSILNGSQGVGISINAGLETQILGGVIDQVQKHGIILSGIVDGVVKTKIIGTWVGHRVAATAGGVGLLVQGQVNDLVIDGLTAAVAPTYGVQFQSAGGNTPNGVVLSKSMFLTNTLGDVFNNGTAGHYKIRDNLFDHPSTNYQEGSNNIASDVDGNSFKVPPVVSTNTRVGKNYGLTTCNSGTAVIPSGSTTVVVTHGLWKTPRPSDISIRPVGIPTNNIGEISVNATDAVTFSIRVRSDPGATGVSFDWTANVAR